MSALTVGLLELAALLHETGIDKLSKPNVMFRQIVKLSSQLYSEIEHVLLMRDLDPKRLLLDNVWINFELLHSNQTYFELGKLDVVRSADVGSVRTVILNITVEKNLTFIDVGILAVQLNELGVAV